MRKALNFDLDTKEYNKRTGKSAPNAYRQIKIFLKNNDFEHRQGSGYISVNNIDDNMVLAVIQEMSRKFLWLQFCVRQIDITNIGKQYSMINAVKSAIEEKYNN